MSCSTSPRAPPRRLLVAWIRMQASLRPLGGAAVAPQWPRAPACPGRSASAAPVHSWALPVLSCASPDLPRSPRALYEDAAAAGPKVAPNNLLRVEPLGLEWQRIGCSYRAATGTKVVLQDVYGKASPGEMQVRALVVMRGRGPLAGATVGHGRRGRSPFRSPARRRCRAHVLLALAGCQHTAEVWGNAVVNSGTCWLGTSACMQRAGAMQVGLGG